APTMPITLTLLGHAPLSPARLKRSEARSWLANAAVWFEGLGDVVLDARVVRDAAERPVLLVVFHPASPPVEVRLGASGRVRISAVTSPTGPGYHIHLCERLHQFAADFDLTWDRAAIHDPTRYFETNDRGGCERHFLRWLGHVSARALDRSGGPNYNDEDGHTGNPTDPSLAEAVTQRAWESDPAAPPIGYRRCPIRVQLCGGWSIEVPGDFARRWDDPRTWTGWNRTRTVWFHPVGFTKPDGSRPTPAEAVAVGRRSLPEGTPVAGV